MEHSLAMALPVLVGIARLTQRVSAPGEGLDAVDLMSEAVRAALDDASAPGLAKRVGLVGVPRGMWRCTDPARVIAERIGAPDARTISAEVGVLQHSLITGACERIASGEVDVAIVCGGEARHRHVLASKAGIERRGASRTGVAPGRGLASGRARRVGAGVRARHRDGARAVRDDLERRRPREGMVVPRTRCVHGRAVGVLRRGRRERRARVGPKCAGRGRRSSRRQPTNRMVSFPYTRLLCSQWNVDQAAALVFASEDVARELGVPSDRAIYPVAAAESNAMVPMFTRDEVHRWPAFEHASRAVLDLAGVGIDDIGLLEIYSCFPSAVVPQLRRARDRGPPPGLRDGWHDVRRRPAQQLRPAGDRRDGRTPSRGRCRQRDS